MSEIKSVSNDGGAQAVAFLKSVIASDAAAAAKGAGQAGPTQNSTPATTPTVDANKQRAAASLINAPAAPAGISAEVAAQKVEAAIARIGDIITKNLVPEGEDATFSAPGVGVLMMFAANGTKVGPEREAYFKALGLEGMTLGEVTRAASAYADKLGSLGDDIKVAYANLAVSNAKFSGGFTEGFGKVSADGAKVIDRAFDPSDKAAVAALTSEINTFVEENTEQLIKNYFDEGTTSALNWMLLSTAAFRGKLTTPFTDPKELLEDPGYVKAFASDEGFRAEMVREAEEAARWSRGTPPTPEQCAASKWSYEAGEYIGAPASYALRGKSVDEVKAALDKASAEADGRMRVRGSGFAFFETPTYSAVSVPYGENRGASMIVMTPKGNATPKSLLASVKSADLVQAAREGASWGHEDLVEMPRFETTFEPDGDKFLQTLGEIAPLDFGDLIKAGNTSPNGAFLKAVINFGPRETVAGQVAGMAVLESAVSAEPQAFVADKPFAYVIVANSGEELWRGVKA